MKLLALTATLLTAALALSQDFETDRTLVFSTPGPSVVTVFGALGFALSPITNGLRVDRMGANSAGDGQRSFTTLGGQAIPTDAAQGDGVLVCGAVDNNGLERMFVARINPFTLEMSWFHLEPPRSVGTRALQVIPNGAFVVVATQVEGGIGAIAFDAVTGTEAWRTTVQTPLRDCRVFRDGPGNVYLVGNRSAGNSTEMFVRSVTAAGFFRWERAYSQVQQGVDGATSGFTTVVLGFTEGLSVIRPFHINPDTGEVLNSPFAQIVGQVSRPLLTVLNDEIRVRVTHVASATRFLITGSRTAPEVQISNPPTPGFDLGTVNLSGVRVTLFRKLQDSLISLALDPDAVWAESVVSTQTDPQDIEVDSAGRLHVVGVSALPGQSELRRIFPRPIARDDVFETPFNEPLFVQPSPGVLLNDEAGFGATLTLVNQPSGGVVTLFGDGSFRFVPTKEDHGVESFTYRLTRGSFTSFGTVKIARQPRAIGMQLSSNRVKGGTSVTARVVMSGPQSLVPRAIPVSENTTATALSASSVQVLPGDSFSQPFTVFTAAVREPVRAAIVGDNGDFSVEAIALLDIDPPFLTGIEAVLTTIVGGAPAEFRLVLDSKAPTNGLPVQVSDNSTAIAVPTTVVIPGGQTSGTFSAPTAVVTSSRTAIVTATSNGVSRSVTIAIVGVTLELAPTSVPGGQPVTGTVTLTSNAIVNSVVFELSDNSTATAPQTPIVIVPAGFRTGTFMVLTVPVTSDRVSTISASNGGIIRSATMTVRTARIESILVSPNQLRGGNPFAGLVTLDGRAAGAGANIQLNSANSVVQVPANLAISAGTTQGLFVGNTTLPPTSLMVIVSASLNGITRTTTIVVTP